MGPASCDWALVVRRVTVGLYLIGDSSVDQQFDNDVMQDLAEGAHAAGRGSPLDEFAGEGDDDAAEDLASDGTNEVLRGDDFGDGFDQGFDEAQGEQDDAEGFEDEQDCADCAAEFAGDGAGDLGDLAGDDTQGDDALEAAMADALATADGESFVRSLLAGVTRLARSAQAARRPNVAPRARAAVGAGALRPVIEGLRQIVQSGVDEFEAFEQLADLFARDDLDAALPVLGTLAARAVVRPLGRRAAARLPRAARRQVVRAATQATRALIQQRGRAAVRALPHVARSVGRVAAQRGMGPAAIPAVLRQAVARVARNPALVRRLSGPTTAVAARPAASRQPQRILLRGPVEIIIHRRTRA